MLSSTSNSNERLPRDSYGKIWVFGLAVFLLAAASIEALERYKGYVPSLKDDHALWALARKSLPENDRGAVVLLGSSRTLCDFDLDEFERNFGTRPIQLAEMASTSEPALDHIARESLFSGLVICEISPHLLFPERSDFIERVRLNVATFHNMEHELFSYKERQMRNFLQSRLVILSSKLQMEDMILGVLHNEWPPAPLVVKSDRSFIYMAGKLDEIRPDVDMPEDPGENAVVTEAHIKLMDKVAANVDMIRSRGGEVIFVYLPCRGTIKVTELEKYPRNLFYDAIVNKTRAISIYSEDYPSLARFKPKVDYNHLDNIQSIEFTREFVIILKAKLAEERTTGP